MDGYHIRLARAEEPSVLPEIEREAAARFAPYGLAGQMTAILTPLESLREGMEPVKGTDTAATALWALGLSLPGACAGEVVREPFTVPAP